MVEQKGPATILEASMLGRCRSVFADDLEGLPPQKTCVLMSLRVGLLLLTYCVLERWFMSCRLPEGQYFQPLIVLELGKHLLRQPIGLLVVAILAIWRWRGLSRPWVAFEHGRRLQYFMTAVAMVMAWPYATYDFNLYLNKAHLVDRLLLTVCVPLIYWRPVFIAPFVGLLVAMVGQFDYPLRGASWAEQFLPVRLLIALVAAFILSLLTKRRKTVDLICLVCCLVASHYWVCGLGKLRLNWISFGQIYNLLPATYANGWLGFLDSGALASMTQFLARIDWPMRILTLVLECGAVFFLCRRAVSVALLLGWICFHLGILAASGICFWKWMVLDLGLLLTCFMHWRSDPLPSFTRCHLFLSVLLIGGAPLCFKPVSLSWYDTPLSYTYRVEAVGASGRHYSLPPKFFAPYDYQFTLGSFGYLPSEPHLGIAWGSTAHRPIAEALMQASSAQEVFAVEKAFGKVHANPQQQETFDAFIRRFLGNWNERRSKETWFSLLRCPPQLWTFPRPDAFDGQEAIDTVRVQQVTSFYDGEQFQEIRRRTVRDLQIRPPVQEAR